MGKCDQFWRGLTAKENKKYILLATQELLEIAIKGLVEVSAGDFVKIFTVVIPRLERFEPLYKGGTKVLMPNLEHYANNTMSRRQGKDRKEEKKETRERERHLQ